MDSGPLRLQGLYVILPCCCVNISLVPTCWNKLSCPLGFRICIHADVINGENNIISKQCVHGAYIMHGAYIGQRQSPVLVLDFHLFETFSCGQLCCMSGSIRT